MTQLSYQLYSSRNFGPLGDTLKMVADAGYTQVEGYGALYANLDDLDGLVGHLHANSLHMATAHVGLDMLENEPARFLEIAKAVGLEAAFVPHLAEEHRPTDAAGWSAFGARLDAAGAPLRDAGMAFGWHNHDFEYRPLDDGSMPMDHILAGGPGLGFEFDVAWSVRAGADPMPVIERLGDRIVAAHIKDIAPAGENLDEDGWADVGKGTMDWPAIMAALRETACKYFVMEHDNPSDDVRFAKASYAFISGL